MVEYYFWEDNKIARANGIVEIRKKFIQKWGKNKVADIYKKDTAELQVTSIMRQDLGSIRTIPSIKPMSSERMAE